MNMTVPTSGATVAIQLADWIARSASMPIPPEVADMSERLLLDYTGLCAAAVNNDYVGSTLAVADPGPCTAFGHTTKYDMYGAALVNGTAAHGEDFDDTFEGGPVHSSAVVFSAVIAACERFGLTGDDALRGSAIGIELLCRLGLVAPKATHKAGFHPTAVFGTLAAAAGVGAALGLNREQLAWAFGIAGSMSSGIIEYLKDGSWTKRMHAGWAAQSGIRAALLAKNGFVGPVSVLEGEHGFFFAFAPSRAPNFEPLLAGLGETWHMTTITFKQYACGTMAQPYVDCAIELSKRGIKADDIESLVCEVGEGTVHRLWEPLEGKQMPPSAYSAKFSSPYCIAVGFVDHAAGLAAFTEEKIRDPEILALASKVSYVVDPENPYPTRFTGHIRATLKDGSVRDVRRENMRGGAHDPLPREELEAKFVGNVLYGGFDRKTADRLKTASATFFMAPDLSRFTGFSVS